MDEEPGKSEGGPSIMNSEAPAEYAMEGTRRRRRPSSTTFSTSSDLRLHFSTHNIRLQSTSIPTTPDRSQGALSFINSLYIALFCRSTRQIIIKAPCRPPTCSRSVPILPLPLRSRSSKTTHCILVHHMKTFTRILPQAMNELKCCGSFS